jgi:hypothetical protein
MARGVRSGRVGAGGGGGVRVYDAVRENFSVSEGKSERTGSLGRNRLQSIWGFRARHSRLG